jgi:hypothetical protein
MLRLLEMLAIACHNIAASLFKNAEGGHQKQNHTGHPTSHASNLDDTILRPQPTDFIHPDYDAWEQYPQGISDIVGYWAEYKLFGGVVLFDRGLSGTEVCLPCLNLKYW